MTEIEGFIEARLYEKEKKILCEWDSDGRARVATMWLGSNPGYTTVASDHANDVWVALGEVMEDSKSITVLWDPKEELDEIQSIREILRWHENWPILVETPMEMETVTTEPDRIVYQMQKKFSWATTNEYIRAYGVDPPTAPILKIIANRWKDHPEFNSEWKI